MVNSYLDHLKDRNYSNEAAALWLFYSIRHCCCCFLQLLIGEFNAHADEFHFKKALDLLAYINKVC